MNRHAVIFDFDGVLAESVSIKDQAFIALFEEYGDEVLDRVMTHHRANRGVSRIEKIRRYHKEILNQELDEMELAELGRRFSGLVEDAVVACAAVPGSREFLEAHAQSLPMFVASGAPEDEVRRVVERRGMSPYFTSVFGSPRPKTPIILEILGEYGFKPEKVLFVGDAIADYQSAQATGVDFAGRVAPGSVNPFPAGVLIIPDLIGLEKIL